MGPDAAGDKGIRRHQVVGSDRHGGPVSRADPHHRADRAGQFRRDETGAGMAWAAGCSRRRCGAAGCVAGGLGAHHLAAVHLGHRAVAPGVGQLPQCDEGGTAGRGGLRGLQTGGVDLPAGGRDRPGGSDIRSCAGPDGVRLHHRAAHPVRHRMGRDVDREPGGRTGGSAGSRADRTARAVPRGSRGWRGA